MMNFDKTANTSIANSPFKLTVYPNKASAQYSYVNGSGIHAVTVGLIADIYLQVKDIYNNDYNKDTLLDKQVYNITVICNSSYSIPVNLTDSSVLSKVQFINQHIQLVSFTSNILSWTCSWKHRLASWYIPQILFLNFTNTFIYQVVHLLCKQDSLTLIYMSRTKICLFPALV